MRFFSTDNEELDRDYLLNLQDEEVLLLTKKDPRAFEILVERYQDAFVGKAKQILGSREDAEDIVQETFVKIYIHCGSFQKQEGASFKSWGYKILVNTCFTRGKKNSLHNKRFTLIDPELECMIEDKNNFFEKMSLSEYVLSVFSRMPEPLAKVLERYFVEGVPQKELADEEGVSVSAIKTRIHRAKKAFRDTANLFNLTQ
jgi:RNA polymerase sigma-70 factor (ECF subfamily)